MPTNDIYPSTSTSSGFGNVPNDPYSTTGAGNTQGVKEKVSDMASQAKQKANEVGSKAAETIDRNLETAAGKLENTAETLRTKAGLGSDRMSQFANTAANKLDATAQYFREHHTRDMVTGMEQAVRKNPGASLAAALALGFLLGSAMKKDRY